MNTNKTDTIRKAKQIGNADLQDNRKIRWTGNILKDCENSLINLKDELELTYTLK
jgi:hypothetical protein